jgi:hypothetical protein
MMHCHGAVDHGYLSANNKKIPLQKFSDARGRAQWSYLLNEKQRLMAILNGHFEKIYFLRSRRNSYQ